MNTVNSLDNKQKKFWVSLTGYRALIILKALMEASLSGSELIEIIKNNNITNKSLSKDTLRVTLNTLKNAGCEFTRPNKSNEYKYELLNNPFGLYLSDNELLSLRLLREICAEDLNLSTILKINKLYDKIIKLTGNQSQISLINNTAPLGDLNENILYEISNPKIIGKKVNINYNSTKNGNENIDIIPFRLVYENNHIYLWCFIFKYQTNTMLNVAKIININSVDISKNYEIDNTYEVIYKVKNTSVKDFILKDYEEIIKSDDNSIIVRAVVSNEFWFIQRILQLGDDFKIISPDFFKKKLLNKVKLIRQRYEK